ncbi:MAG: IclR family transcriptional regulator [Finegoldia sp.]|nr:IclR family transcriptional regulator [Finegoldia sp.]
MHMPTLRVIKILKEVSKYEKGLSMTDIAEKTDIPKSTLSPILKTLVEGNFLELSNNQYLIGFEVYKLASSYTKKSDAISIIKSYMKNIVEECNEICQLGIYEDGMVFYIAKVEPRQSIKIVSSVGSRLAANAPALGKALISKFDDSYIREFFKDKMVKYTENSTVNMDELIGQVRDVRENGYALEYGEISDDIRCIATPLEVDGDIVAAMSISIPNYRAGEENLNRCTRVLLKYKKIIEKNLTGMDINL